MNLSHREIFDPYVPEKTIHEESGMSYGQSLAGYDIRIKQNMLLCKGEFYIASTLERFTMPNHLVGIVHDKSSLARKGLSVFNTVIEPGWKGFLTLELVYHGDEPLEIYPGQPIAQVIFHMLLVGMQYQGKYQNQPDRPVEAIHEVLPGNVQPTS